MLCAKGDLVVADRQAGNRKASDLGIRTVSGLAMIVLAGLALYLGGHALWLLLTLGALAIQYEWAGLVGQIERRQLSMLALTVPLSILSPFAAGPGFLAIGLFLAAASFMVAVDRGWTLAAGVLYAGLPVLALLYLREQGDGLLLALWCMALVWATDIGAYFAGRTIGGPKLAPAISPNKTWSGLAGGIAAATIFGLLLYRYFDLPLVLAMASGPLAALAQVGDLFESALKRKAGVKDSGHLIPGHGGVMDRVDGLVPVAPVAALLVAVMGVGTLG